MTTTAIPTDAAHLQEKWTLLFPDIPPPSERQFTIWLIQHTPEIIQHGLAQAAVKNVRLAGTMDQDYAVRFASSVMNRLTLTRN